MIIKIVCSCGKDRKPIVYVREGDDGPEVVALIESECPHCIGYGMDKLSKNKGGQ